MNFVKWGVVGCGGIANRRTIPGMLLADNAKLVAVMDVNAELAEDVGEKYQASAVCTSVEDLLRQDIDAVYIATPVFLHKEQAIAAMRAGKHVFVEKPVGLCTQEVDEICRIAQEVKVKLGVGLLMRFHSQHQKMKELVAAGVLGEIVSMRAQWGFWYPDIPGNWRQKKELAGGGALMDVGIHCVDLMQFISGLKPKGVFAFCDTQSFSYDVDDNAALLVKMENGAHLFVEANFNIPDQSAPTRLEVYGTKGSMVAEGTLLDSTSGKVQIILADGSKPYFLDPGEGNMYTKEIAAFSDAILKDCNPPVGVEQARIVHQIIDAAYQSAETGIYVALT